MNTTPTAAQSAADKAAHLALKGYDPVAYFMMGKPVKGSPNFEMDFDGSRYRFYSLEHKKLFSANPDRYAPQFAGACAKGVSMGMKIEANPYLWRIIDGKLYVFSSSKVITANMVPVIEKARANWKDVKDQPFK